MAVEPGLAVSRTLPPFRWLAGDLLPSSLPLADTFSDAVV